MHFGPMQREQAHQSRRSDLAPEDRKGHQSDQVQDVWNALWGDAERQGAADAAQAAAGEATPRRERDVGLAGRAVEVGGMMDSVAMEAGAEMDSIQAQGQ